MTKQEVRRNGWLSGRARKLILHFHILHGVCLHYLTDVLLPLSLVSSDGLCCSYGSGGFGIYDSNSAQEVYTNDGQFGHYYELDINIGLDGVATVELSDSHWYRPGSWSRFENMAWMPDDKSDTSWPGEVPLADTNAVVVNIKTVRLDVM